MTSISWTNLRSLDGSQASAFEELCCQLARHEVPAEARFTRKGTPDAGVECFAFFPDGSEWAWQAKFFETVGQSQWKQLDDSVQTALSAHPRLTRYTICLPIDRPDARVGKQKSLLEKWNERVAKWEAWATKKRMEVRFDYWGSHELWDLLSREEHRGRVYFWFGRELFTQRWFMQRLEVAIKVAGPRYTPEVDVQLPITRVFDGLGRTDSFFGRIKAHLRNIKKEYARVSRPLSALGENVAESELDLHARQLLSSLQSIDPSPVDPIPYGEISDLVERVIDMAETCLERHNEVERQPRQTGEHTEVEDAATSDRLAVSARGYHLRSFLSTLWALQDFLQSAEVRLSNLPALLLLGQAGKGKTHLFCDIAKKRINVGLPTIILMGQSFFQEEPWSQIVKLLHLNPQTTPDELLGALEAAAQSRGTRALILIDALNEGEGRRIWKRYLAGMLQTISQYRWISIALSVRSSYENAIVPEEVFDTVLVRVTHPGFAEHEYEAMRTFFDFYEIERPSVPLLAPEFETPLFLKILCSGLKKKSVSKVPTGLVGVTAIFDLFIDAVETTLSEQEHLDYRFESRIVRQAIGRIAEAMALKQTDRLFVEEVERITKQVFHTSGYEKSLLRYLVSEGILIQDSLPSDKGEWYEVIRFGYEKFSDHVIARHLLDKYLDSNEPEKAFTPDQSLAFIVTTPQRFAGLIEALSVQMPERLQREFPEVVPQVADSETVAGAFVQSLIWRDPRAVTDSTDQFLNRYLQLSDIVADQIFDALLTVATNPEHLYNADFLHDHLRNLEMADRDSFWSIFLHEQYGAHGAVDRLVDWAWSSEKKGYVVDEAVRLTGTALAWFLTTSNRFLRDRATKALVNLFTDRIHVLKELIEQFLDVDDPYVLERLFAVAYGCTLRSVNDESARELAQAVYDWVFRDNQPPVHILLRDYARGVVEYALYKSILLDVDIDKIRPPYHSKLPAIPSEDEIKKYELPGVSWNSGDPAWSQNRIYHSVMDDDFAWYVIGTNAGSSDWLGLRLDEPSWRSSEDEIKEFIESLPQEQVEEWRLLQDLVDALKVQVWLMYQSVNVAQHSASDEFNTGEHELTAESTPEQLLQIAGPERRERREELEDKVERALSQLRATLDEDKRVRFEKQVLPYLFESPQDEPPEFDLTSMQRWILYRVFELGWTVGRFGHFDRFQIGMDANRSGHKAERIGKKYQWIAYYEFLARLADNFQFRAAYSSHRQGHRYDGTWQLGVRDIDPSSVLRVTKHTTYPQASPATWWVPSNYTMWELSAEDKTWMKRVDDLPDVQSLISLTRPTDNSQWLTLDGFYTWEQPIPLEQDKYDIARREIWYMLRGYLVHQADMEHLFEWGIKQNYMGRWMPESRGLYEVFLGEFFWSPAYSYYSDPVERAVGWQEPDENTRWPRPILPLAEGYMHEASGSDCSVDDVINIRLPAQFLVERMGLHWIGVEGSYFDKTGTLIAFDPSVREVGPRVLLVDRSAFLSFLSENSYAVLWILLGEKQVIGGPAAEEDWKGRMELSGAYCMHEGQIVGSLTPRFREPID